MKNKGLIASIIILFAILVGTFAFEMGKSSNNQAGSERVKEEKTVGILQFVSHPALNEIRRGVEDGLAKRGYVKDKNLKIVFQNGQADQSKLATMSQQLVQKKADALVGIATPAAQSLANVTQNIPIILGAVTDPVSAKLVDDMDHPGGNITGVSDKSPVNEQFKLAQELLPQAKTVGILYSSTEDNSKYQVAEAQKAAQKLGMKVKRYPVPSTNEISQTVQVMSGQVDFMFIPLDNTIANAMPAVVNEANKKKLPIIPSVDTMVEQGGLATIGINQYDLGVKTGEMTADILDGKKKPADTPVYTFKTGDVIINKEQAEKLNIDLPASVTKNAKFTGGDDK